MTAVGSFEWALQTGGRLRRFDGLRLTAIALRAQVVRRLTGGGLNGRQAVVAQRLTTLDLDAIEIPASAAARQALEACRDTGLPYLLHHCARTYLYGAILSALQGLNHDPELLYCAAMLHDVSIASHHAKAQPTGQPLVTLRCQCFAHASATWSLQWALQIGWPEARANQLADAISRHLNPSVPLSDGIEAHLLNAGAALDVAGIGRHAVPPHVRDAVGARWSRLNQNEALASFMANEAQACPQGRLAWLAGHGFIERIRDAK